MCGERDAKPCEPPQQSGGRKLPPLMGGHRRIRLATSAQHCFLGQSELNFLFEVEVKAGPFYEPREFVISLIQKSLAEFALYLFAPGGESAFRCAERHAFGIVCAFLPRPQGYADD